MTHVASHNTPIASPQIAHGTGSMLPEKYALRAAERWIEAIDNETLMTTRALMKFRDSGPLPGNQIASKRWINRYRRIGGSSIIAGWGVFRRGKGSVFVDKVGRADIDQPTKSINVMRWQFEKLGRVNPRVFPCHGTVCELSPMAVVGLIRYAGLESASETLDFLSFNWRAISSVSALVSEYAEDVIIPVEGRSPVVLVAKIRPAFICAGDHAPVPSDHHALIVTSVVVTTSLPSAKIDGLVAIRRSLAADPSAAPGILNAAPPALINAVRSLEGFPA
jgi:hypothetical protein